MKRLESMDGMRAYAAGIVFLFHSALLMQEHQGMTGWAVDWMLHGQYGVDVFFILSGYLIAGLVVKPDFQFGSYLLHRVARIYPAMLAMFALCIVGMVVLRGQVPSVTDVLANVFLINKPLGIHPLNNVTWSLMYEFAFYFTFPFLYRRFGLMSAAIITAAVIVPLSYFDGFYLRFMFFYAGVWMRLTPNRPWEREGVAVALYVIVTTATMYMKTLWLFLLLFAPVATLVIDRLLHKDGPVARFLSHPWLQFGGKISYSFYLLHPIGLLVAQYAAKYSGLTGWAWAGVLISTGFVVSLVMATVSYYVLEKPYFTLRQKGLGTKPATNSIAA